MTGNRMNCSLWYWLRRPTEFKRLVRYCNTFGWRYFWRDTFPLSWAEWMQLIGQCGFLWLVLSNPTAPLFSKIGIVGVGVFVVVKIVKRHWGK